MDGALRRLRCKQLWMYRRAPGSCRSNWRACLSGILKLPPLFAAVRWRALITWDNDLAGGVSIRNSACFSRRNVIRIGCFQWRRKAIRLLS
jgi:hypothetical protein